MNDPIPFFDGESYRVYFQHNPNAAFWGDMHWGHAVSRDLMHWETLPIALAPTPDLCDRDGIWTGCVTRNGNGQMTALYTGITELNPAKQVQCVAFSNDGIHWLKHPHNPVIAQKPEGFGACFRDPQVFETGDGNRYLLIGGELRDGQGGTAFLYRATDVELTAWEYLHTLYDGDDKTGYDFECPDFFPMGEDRWLLITSRHKTWWHIGRLTEDLRFEREAVGACDDGNFYAAKTLVDSVGEGLGRRLLFGWITESRSREAQVADGWSGVLSLPRVVTSGDDGLPRFTPAPELEGLRGTVLQETDLHTSKAVTLPDTCEIEVEYALLHAPAQMTLQHANTPDKLQFPVPPAPDGKTTVRLFVDRSVIEVFVNERVCHTFRLYPTQPGEITLQIDQPTPASATLTAWEIATPEQTSDNRLQGGAVF
jgi:beta-fructofuranosidase